MESITDQLFAVMRSDDHVQMKYLLENLKANPNTKNSNRVSLLHIAAWKSPLAMVKVILANRANPDISGPSGTTPLHYAVRYTRLDVVKELLAYGAKYNVPTTGKKPRTPLELCTTSRHRPIRYLLLTIHISFESIDIDRNQMVSDLNKITDIGGRKAVVNARNCNYCTLIQQAVRNNRLDISETVDLFRNDEINHNNREIIRHYNNKEYDECIQYLNKNLESRVDMFGYNSPVALVIEKQLCSIVMDQRKYVEALDRYNRICKLEIETLGENCLVTLRTIFDMATVLCCLEKYEDALPIMKNAVDRIGEFEGAEINYDYARMRHSLGKLNRRLRDYKAASENHERAYDIVKEIHPRNHPETILYLKHMCCAMYKNNMVDEATIGLEAILRYQKKFLEPGHSETLATQNTIANLYGLRNNNEKGELALKDLLDSQKKYLGLDHEDTLLTQNRLAKCLKRNDKWSEAKRLLDTCVDRMISVLGPKANETIASKALLDHLSLITD